MLQDILVYGQVLEALRIAKVGWLREEIIDKWVRKLRLISCNLDTFEHNTNINKKEVYQREENVYKIKKPVETVKGQVSISEEHHLKRENIAEEVEQGLEILKE